MDLDNYDDWKTATPDDLDEREWRGNREPIRDIRPDERCPFCDGYTVHPYAACGRCAIAGLEKAIAGGEKLAKAYIAEGDTETSERVTAAREQVEEWKERLAAMGGGRNAA